VFSLVRVVERPLATRLPTPEACHRRQAHPDVSVTGATECCDRFNGSAPTIDWWHFVSGISLLVAVDEGRRRL
jgi:hypothetical protein